MKIMKTPTIQIEGVTITQLLEIKDERGSVLHMLRNDSEDFTRFGECYFSEVLPGVVKAWKKHKEQTQNLAVPVGRIRLVIYDGRENSLTRGKTGFLELGRPDDYHRVKIPPGLWYGFKCISSIPALIANCADFPHNKNESEIIDLFDNSIPYFWS
jgi:dTDP-4-dehydrorhamnose 3,5-epimerase